MLADLIHFDLEQLTAKKIQRMAFSLGAITFTFASLATLPIFSDKTSYNLYISFIRTSILLLSVSEIISLSC